MNVPAGSAKCISCGADCDPRIATCWLCYSKLGDAGANPYAVGLQSTVNDPNINALQQPVVDTAYTTVDYIFMALLIGCVILTVLIGIGTAIDDPAGLIGFAIVVSPAYIITALRTLSRTNRTGAKPRPAQMLSTLLLSGVATLGVITLLGIAAIVLLVAVCFGAIATGNM